ncbi:hypothetical protein [Lysinibacillus sp. BW-2-10]|uniref:hypothetical protein n=1 Tax=Lysinibacillus sp. BW-2-10 TaxID=2590030 RepID=UPI00117F5F9E|nr:hypothetical protein [Lysinibacillus sp. BW-2-10]TSI07661.1 hypothetical protein FJQ64_08180 [Lysinibacillus sp. BW-2-10]
MWKITNNTNYIVLKKFEQKVIRPFLLILWDASEQQAKRIYNITKPEDIWKNTNPYKKYSIDQQKIIDYFFRRAVDGQKFYDVFLNIIGRYNKTEVISIIKLYIRQNNFIYKNDYNLKEIKCPPEFKTIFITFFYEKFFTLKTLWKMVAGIEYNRGNFHENFYKENMEIKVCPYCDMALTVSKSSNYVEHFLPKAKFPLLSMNPYNLISSCDSCNKGEEGKGENVKSDITTPYNHFIGEYIDFNLKKGVIHLSNLSNLSSIDNYLDLLKLEKRYGQDKAFKYLKTELEIQFEYFSEMDNLSQSKIDDFLTKRDRHSPFNIALKSVIKKYPAYKSYL